MFVHENRTNNKNVLTRGRTDRFSNILPLVTVKFDL